jgi:hypothetical protein
MLGGWRQQPNAVGGVREKMKRRRGGDVELAERVCEKMYYCGGGIFEAVMKGKVEKEKASELSVRWKNARRGWDGCAQNHDEWR